MLNVSTQDHLDIEDIQQDFVVLKNNRVCAVLQTTAVNFDLLSEIEQDAMISSFAMLLNSISFPVQVVIRSKQLDISKYLEKVVKTEYKTQDPRLKVQVQQYRKFVQEVIEANNVLDKKFYVIVFSGDNIQKTPGSSPFEFLSILTGRHAKRVNVNVNKLVQKAKIDLTPKIEHLTSEFSRIGVKAKQLDTQKLVELYFDIYNPSSVHGQRIRTNIEDYKTAIVNPAIIEE